MIVCPRRHDAENEWSPKRAQIGSYFVVSCQFAAPIYTAALADDLLVISRHERLVALTKRLREAPATGRKARAWLSP